MFNKKEKKEPQVLRVKLSVLNRLSLLGLLTNIGDSTSLKILREFREELGFTEEQHALLKFQQLPGGKVKWDEELFPSQEFEFAEGSIRLGFLEEVKTHLRKEEEKKTLKLDLLSLYEATCEKKEELKIVEK